MNYPNLSDDPGVDLREVFAVLWLRKWWIVAITTAFVATAVATAFLLQPIYRATVVLASAVRDRSGLSGDVGSALGNLGGVASIVGLGNGADAETEEALAVLKSRQLTESFIRSKGLMPVLFAKQWDSATNDWKPGVKTPTSGMAYKVFNRIREVEKEKKNVGLYALQVDWKDREQAADWANSLVSFVNAEMRARAISENEAMLSYLEKEFASTSVIETRQAINRLIEIRIKQRMLANVTQEYAFRVVDKAVVADANDPVKPKKRLVVAAGFLAGVMFAVGGVLVVAALRNELRVTGRPPMV